MAEHLPEGRGGKAPPARARRRSTLVACLLAWLLPGAGHVYVGQRLRGLLFFFLLTPTFFGGLYMDARLFVFGRGDPVEAHAGLIAITGPFLDVACGLPYALALGTKAHANTLDGNIESPYYEIGVTFTLVAGLLNLLVIMDAFDLAAGRKPIAPPLDPDAA